jgi:hypothetical protein
MMTEEAVPSLHVEFCGAITPVEPPGPFVIGREGDLAVDDNEYLHRNFLTLSYDRFWWLTNVGRHLSATVCDTDAAMQSWIAPGTALPLLFAGTEVRFTAGPTNYCVTLMLERPAMVASGTITTAHGTTTVQPVSLTERQRCVVLALAEPALLSGQSYPSELPSSPAASERLGWKLTTFNRQLDAVCHKLDRAGVRGVHGDSATLASGRRARLVEYALAVRMVTPEDIPLLDEARALADS